MDAIAELWEKYLAKVRARGAPTYDATAYDELRCAAYAKIVGRTASHVFTLPVPTPPFPVEVQLFDERPAPDVVLPPGMKPLPQRRAKGRVTLATMGMSSERMVCAREVPPERSRVELVFFMTARISAMIPDLSHFMSDVMLHASKQPFLNDAPIDEGDVLPIVPIGQGETYFLYDETTAGLLLVEPPRTFPESELPRALKLDGDPVRFLAMVPVTHEEIAFARIVGTRTFLEECSALPFVYDGPRRSLV
jgi:hypothetical protein